MSDISDKLSFPGEINVIAAQIISSTGQLVDISSMIGDITIYEDIFSNCMTGYVLIQDSLDLVSTIPLIGQEQLILELQTPTLTKKISKTFYIYKLQNRVVKKRSQTYMLNFCSKELIYSENTKISKAFSGNISDTVVSIFSDPKYLGADTRIYVDRTKNDYSFISPYWSPLQTINWLTGKSINQRGVSNYLFYETNQSYEYTSVDTLLRAISEREYIYSDVDANSAIGFNGDKDDKYKFVSSMSNGVTFDYLRNVSGGMYSSKLYTMDMTTRNIETNTFDYIDDFSKSTHLEKEPLRTSGLMRKKLASLYFIEKNNYQTGSLKKQGYKDFFLQRNSLLEQLSAFKISIKVHGRTDIKAGNIITFTVPDLRQILGDEIETTGKSDYFSGRYLITAIRHQIVNGVHSMEMEIVSDSFVKSLITK